MRRSRDDRGRRLPGFRRTALIAVLAAMLFAGGCALCPFGSSPINFFQFISFKLDQALTAEGWVPMYSYVFHQRVEVPKLRVVLNGEFDDLPGKRKIRFRNRLWDGDGNILMEETVNARYRRNGKLKKAVTLNYDSLTIEPDWWLSVEARSNKPIPEGTLAKMSVNVFSESEQP